MKGMNDSEKLAEISMILVSKYDEALKPFNVDPDGTAGLRGYDALASEIYRDILQGLFEDGLDLEDAWAKTLREIFDKALLMAISIALEEAGEL